MKTTNISIAVDSEKLAAVRQYTAKKNVDIAVELNNAVEKLYEKYVPATVREYIEGREGASAAAGNGSGRRTSAGSAANTPHTES